VGIVVILLLTLVFPRDLLVASAVAIISSIRTINLGVVGDLRLRLGTIDAMCYLIHLFFGLLTISILGTFLHNTVWNNSCSTCSVPRGGIRDIRIIRSPALESTMTGHARTTGDGGGETMTALDHIGRFKDIVATDSGITCGSELGVAKVIVVDDDGVATVSLADAALEKSDRKASAILAAMIKTNSRE